MPISRGDRFRLLCFIGKTANFKAFRVAYWRQEKEAADRSPNALKALQRSFKGWCGGRGFHEATGKKIFGALKTAGWPVDIPSPEELLDTDATVPAFLNACKLSYVDVEHLLSPGAKAEWAAGHHNLHFMKALDKQSTTARAKALLPALKGTYRLYRRHSMLPGLLREYFFIDDIRDGHCEGWYIQYSRTSPANLIPFNAFFCEFYVLAFGAHQAEGERTEIVTVSVLVENAFSRDKLVCDRHNRHFLGLLTGIYDFGNILLAERVLIEREKHEVSIEKDHDKDGIAKPIIGSYAPIHIHNDDPKYRAEYLKAIDVIDNALDGQTLAVRADRIELVRDISLRAKDATSSPPRARRD
jgi:hypothetical protein